MAQMNISNTLFNDTSSGVLAYVEQLKDRLLKDYIANSPDFNATDRNRIPSDLQAAVGVFQGKLNEFFLKHWVEYQRFLLDEGIDPDTIDSWYEVKRFLDGLDDDTAMWLKNKLKDMDDYLYDLHNIDGGAFDISAANQSGGVYAQYATLADALAAVPDGSKKSGMTVRFLSSYTGQYEQFRYMFKYESTTAGNEAFLNTANWRGVDFYPSQNSENLVRSGGIYEWAGEAGEIVDVSSDDWEPTTAEQRFEQLQREITDLNAVVNTTQLKVGAVETDVVPTEGSGHTITSGGVYTALHTQDEKIEDNSDAIDALNRRIATEESTRQQGDAQLIDRINAVDNKIGNQTVETQINNKVASLDARASQTASAANGQLNLSVTEEDGKITSISGSIKPNTYDSYGAASAEAERAQGAEQNLQQGINAKYTKPSTGIPKDDLAAAVKDSLDKADSALQEHQDISGKVDKVDGKALSANDFTDTLKAKLDGIAAGAEVNVQGDWNQTNTGADDYIKNKPTKVSDFTNDAGYLTQHQSLAGHVEVGELVETV